VVVSEELKFLPEIPLLRAAWPGPGEKPFEWAAPEIGHRSKLGGEPDFERSHEWPICSCGTKMNFYGQLDSISDEFAIGDVGMIYVFLCFGCFEAKSITQFS
jgi:hypothetical protein